MVDVDWCVFWRNSRCFRSSFLVSGFLNYFHLIFVKYYPFNSIIGIIVAIPVGQAIFLAAQFYKRLEKEIIHEN
jgi:hypothetical protein